MKINNVNTQYEIPGFDIAPQALEPGEDNDFEGAPYSRDPGITSPPPAGGWQRLLGLMEPPPTPTRIDPPTRQVTGRSRSGDTASYSVVGIQADPGNSQLPVLSPRVSRMMALLASRQEVVAKIRIRAAEVSQ
ncbi:hypothetical protein [Edaphobacter modestus]|uniref:Uncharacterized protein n=1 Tax=Edaphobacter modestus TaxID=388466 RepID=A0A4Q7YYB4_9BACT|nr:hypothetical protein [Edaphobacter modestus]RZU42241.1 hypothetical protein BDD14_3794 [Edaphobacter modestus]